MSFVFGSRVASTDKLILVVSVLPRFIVSPNPALPVQTGGGGGGGQGQVAAGGCCADATCGVIANRMAAPAILIARRPKMMAALTVAKRIMAARSPSGKNWCAS